jgi:hypothetical protein
MCEPRDTASQTVRPWGCLGCVDLVDIRLAACDDALPSSLPQHSGLSCAVKMAINRAWIDSRYFNSMQP